MGNSQIVNGHDYIYVPIQLVSATDTQYVLRAVVYVISYNVIDSVNNLTVSGNWSRSGALPLNGVYNVTPVWSQDITVNRVYGSSQTVSVNVSWSGVEYWGQTLVASESYTVPARPPSPPTAPYGYSARDITSSQATSTGVSVASNNGAALNNLQAQVNTSASETGASTFTAGSFVDVTMTGLVPGTGYYFRLRAANSAGWSDWGSWVPFTTLATVPGTPGSLAYSNLDGDSVRLTWTAPAANGSAIIANQVQIATDSTFASGIRVDDANASSGQEFTGLLPGRQHFARVRSRNAVGYGPWSATLPFTTPSSIRVKVAGTWVAAIPRVKVAGSWVNVLAVRVKQGGVWVG